MARQREHLDASGLQMLAHWRQPRCRGAMEHDRQQASGRRRQAQAANGSASDGARLDALADQGSHRHRTVQHRRGHPGLVLHLLPSKTLMGRRLRWLELRRSLEAAQCPSLIQTTRSKESIMKLLESAVLICSIGFAGAALAQDASVTISSPMNGAKVGMKGVKVDYSVVTGAKGDHVHFYVDGNEAAVLRQLKGSYTVDKLTAGDHDLCIKIVDKGHTPIGVEKCIKVTAG
jgi:hypothetical protein